MVIPIHAYPCVNTASFPTRVNFPTQPVSTSITHHYYLSCSVPIQFEYALTLLKPSPCFTISPQTGLIPPNGKARICVTFTPDTYGTFTAKLQVNVSQFNFTPFVCQITGASHPGLHRKNELENAAARLTQDLGPEMGARVGIGAALGHTTGANQINISQQHGDGSQMLETYDRGVPRATERGKGSGAVNDAGADWYTTQMIKKTLPPRDDPGPAPLLPESTVEGLRFPGDMDSLKAVNYVLTQTAGKLKPKDLKEAIRKQREFRAKQKEEQAEARARTAGGTVDATRGGGNANDPAQKYSAESIVAFEFNDGSTRQIKEMAFLQDIQEIEKDEREREFKSSVVFIGEPLMTDNHVTEIDHSRNFMQTGIDGNARQSERMRTDDKFMGPLEVPAKYARATTSVGSGQVLAKVHGPTFDEFKNDLWKKRKKQLSRLVFLTGQFITRARVERRLAAIMPKIEGRTKEEMRVMIELDCQQAANNSSGMGKKKKTAAEIEKEKEEKETDGQKRKKKFEQPFVVEEKYVVRGTVPMFEEDASIERMAVDISQKPMGFQDLALSTLRAGIESVEHGYTAFEFPMIDTYVPIERDRELKVGAFEESSVRPSRDEGDVWFKEERLGGAVERTGEELDAKGKPVKGGKGAASPREEGEGDAGVDFLNGLLKQSGDLEKTVCMPESMKVYNAPNGLNLLRHDSSVRVYAPVTKILQETDLAWDVRPRFIPRVVADSVGKTYSERVGSSTLHAHRNIKHVSTVWRPRRERKVTSLNSLAVNTRQGLWELKDLPPLQAGMVQEDLMSDSESEGESDDVFIPTEAGCKKFFSEGGGEDGAAAEGESTGSGVQVMRDRQQLELARVLRENRCDMSSRLDDRMAGINAKLKNIKHLFFLQKPFFRLKQQYPQWEGPEVQEVQEEARGGDGNE